MKYSKHYLTLWISLLVLSSCSPAPSIQKGEFSSMLVCLDMVQKTTGMKLDILRDNKDIVSGYLAKTKRDFACERKVTGSRGIYFEGWFEE